MNTLDSFQSEIFEDEYGYSHTTTSILGQGGQGAVYRTKDVDVALKISLKNGKRLDDINDIKQAKRAFNKLKYLPIKGLKLSTPISILTSDVGYLMPLMSDMKPFSSFIFAEQNRTDISKIYIDDYITNIIKDDYNQRMIAFYIKSGGVKRRLKALYRCALVLHDLHSRGLFFADINPNNEYISSDLNYEEVWLIDADNLNYDKPNTHDTNIYFPKYGAPEVVNYQAKSSIASDCYSFAILSHIILVQNHPFEGKALETDSSWDDEDSDDWNDITSKSETGDLAWIFSDTDTSNQNKVPLHFLITEMNIFKLFKQTFESGKFDVLQRPPMSLWAIGLAKMHDELLPCAKCHFTFASLTDEQCDFCGTKRPSYIKIHAFNQHDKKIWTFVEDISENEIKIPIRIISHADDEIGSFPLFHVQIKENDMLISKSSDDWRLIILSDKNKKEYEIYNRFKTEITMHEPMFIRVQSKNSIDKSYMLKLSVHC